MALFGKKEKAEQIDPREKVEATIEQTEAFVRRSEVKRKELLEKAKTAKARGDKASFNMAVNALRTIMQQQKRAEQMTLTMSIVLDLRDVNAMTASFMENMQYMCTQMSQLPDMKKMGKLSAEFSKNMEKMNTQAEKMDLFMTEMFESMDSGEYSDVSFSDEIGKMIESELAAELDSEDIAIAQEIEAAKNRA